jgi:uncharacterized coiled-coil protein SlyX
MSAELAQHNEAAQAVSQQTGQTLKQLLDQINELIVNQGVQFRKLQQQVKTLTAEVEREQRKNAKQRQANTRAKRTVVQKPVSVNDEMRTFMASQKVEAVDGGFTRQVMMRTISGYIKTHKLELEADRKRWRPDATLSKLLKLNDKETFTFLTINGLISRVIPSVSK